MPFISSVRGNFGPQAKGIRTLNKSLITGGTISTISGYRVHTFSTTGSFTLDYGANTGFDLGIEVSLIGGGGSAGVRHAGGGGAGGVFVWSPVTINAPAPIVVGAGPPQSPLGPAPGVGGSPGGFSQIIHKNGTLRADGGGGGAIGGQGNVGGSGGGTAAPGVNPAFGYPYGGRASGNGTGNPGGAGGSYVGVAGGGGGFSGAGQTGGAAPGFPTNRTLGGTAGDKGTLFGPAFAPVFPGPANIAGGGGGGGYSGSGVGSPGDHLGAGGQAGIGSSSTPTTYGGAGFPGIVVVRYPIA